MRLLLNFLTCILIPFTAFGQSVISDSVLAATDFQKANNTKFHIKELLAPVTLISYGIFAMQSSGIKFNDKEISEEVTEHIDDKISIDDFTQYLPAAAVYGLNAFGVKGKNNFKDRSIVLGTSYLLMTTTVLILKNNTHVQRPDGTSNNSFPSGHTATAFASAEFLWQEYRDVSVWYGVSGYIVATGTGAFRIYNNRHWLTDVVMGAGIGMLTTKIAYWMYPPMQRIFCKSKNNKKQAMLLPFFNGKQTGIGFAGKF